MKKNLRVMRKEAAGVTSSARQQGGRHTAQMVYVGMSGGVDSSLTAALLKEQGYDVVGAYMKNWSQDLPGFPCPWKEDYQDAKRVAVQLDIPLKLFNFETEYKQKVVDYMLDEYKAGRTPNPDIMCNQEVKFKLFLQTALEDGADIIATGHYARTEEGQLLTAKDDNKDQTYFLYRVTKDALKKTLFPLGDMNKEQVRQEAAKRGLATANKAESMGICFVGKVGIREFLSQYVTTKPGNIIEQHGVTVGTHDGAIFYTIGQRHGLDVGGGLPYYVTGKDMKKNEVFVTTDLQDDKLWSSSVRISDIHLISISHEALLKQKGLKVRLRHRGPLIAVRSVHEHGKKLQLELADDVRAVTPGQSAVLYSGNQCLGGGILT